jgi:hypothetical protein
VYAHIDILPLLLRCEPLRGGDPVVRGLGVVGDREVFRNQLPAGEGHIAPDSAYPRGVDGLLRRETVIDQKHQAGAAVEALKLDDLGKGVVELGGLEVLLKVGDQVVGVLLLVTAKLDRGPVAQDFIGNGIDVASGDAVDVEGFEFALAENGFRAYRSSNCLVLGR